MVGRRGVSLRSESLLSKGRSAISRRKRSIARGEVWLVTLDPTIGSEIQKTRPCVIVSPPEMHGHLCTAIVAPMTTGGSPAPFRIEIGFQGKRGLVLLDQIRSLDKQRLVRRLGVIDASTLKKTLARLQETFAE